MTRSAWSSCHQHRAVTHDVDDSGSAGSDANGCTAVASGDGFNLFGAASATGEFSTPNFTVPNDVSLLGAELAAQAIAVDAAANAAGLVASRGLLVRIGN